MEQNLWIEGLGVLLYSDGTGKAVGILARVPAGGSCSNRVTEESFKGGTG